MIDKKDSKPLLKPTPNSTIIPKSIAQRCPVCNGFGTLKYGSITCHACAGRGYVLVPAELEAKR
jgi:DnaJ-class molecular chaperone